MDELGFEDKEILLQVMEQAVEKMTRTQSLCVLALVAGWNQEEVGEMLDISHQAVSHNYHKALGVIKNVLV